MSDHIDGLIRRRRRRVSGSSGGGSSLSNTGSLPETVGEDYEDSDLNERVEEIAREAGAIKKESGYSEGEIDKASERAGNAEDR